MLKHTEKRVVISVDIEAKNNYRFGNGVILKMFPNTENLDRRFSAPVNGIVISADEIPIGSECLVEHNSCHPTNQIFEYKSDNPNIKYFSVPELEVFVWRFVPNVMYLKRELCEIAGSVHKGWHPTKYYAIAERVYEPYKGALQNIKPARIKNTLLIKTGKLKNKIVHTVKNGEYEIIYQDTDGKPNRILVVFHVEHSDELSDLILNAKQEITAINHQLTERYLNGELYAGLTPDDCKPIKGVAYAD